MTSVRVPLPIGQAVGEALAAALRQLLLRQLGRTGAKRVIGMLGAAITPEIISKILLIGLTIWLIWDLIEIFNYYFNIREIIGRAIEKILEEIYNEDATVPLPGDMPPNLRDCIQRCVTQSLQSLDLYSWAKGNGSLDSVIARLRDCIRVCFGIM